MGGVRNLGLRGYLLVNQAQGMLLPDKSVEDTLGVEC